METICSAYGRWSRTIFGGLFESYSLNGFETAAYSFFRLTYKADRKNGLFKSNDNDNESAAQKNKDVCNNNNTAAAANEESAKRTESV